MKEKRYRNVAELISLLVSCFFLLTSAFSVHAQSTSADADPGQKRLKRARALVAAHQLDAAANELTAIRNTTTDDSVRDVARIMLMSIFLEEGDYMRAQSLLEETYRARSAQNENSTRTYFALAGQAVNGAREHLSRYRSFGINITDKELPAEATSDLEHMRMLLERVAEQAQDISSQSEKSFDALGLLEEAANLRTTLARNEKERAKWQGEVNETRQKLAASETRIASISATPVRRPATANETPAIASNPTSPNHSTSMNAKKATPAASNNRTAKPAKQENAATEVAKVSAPKDGKPLDIGSLVQMATQKVNPNYPQTAKSARISGLVTVYVEVDENGAVKSVRSTNGPQLLRQAAEDAARRWKFKPTVIEGQPVRVQGYINFNFTL
ncbi:MAG: tetratricopeptide repeat protein [Acidobacteriota bacterium]|nr:tetratricopeptide repeat protein [Acidobacteriota bacterium]